MYPAKIIHVILSFTTTKLLEKIVERREISYERSLGLRHNPEYFIRLAKQAPPKASKYLYALSCWAQSQDSIKNAHDIYKKSKTAFYPIRDGKIEGDHEVSYETFQRIVDVYRSCGIAGLDNIEKVKGYTNSTDI